MASTHRPTSDAVTFEQALTTQPFKFGFYQTLRRLECIYHDKPRLGTSLRPIDDAVRLAQEPSLAFAPSTLASFKCGQNGDVSQLAVYFFGLFGPNGPLPLHLTEYARDRLRNSDDTTLTEFVNMFHHRMLSLFYRSWANAQPTVNFDRPSHDRFRTYVGALFGLGMPSLRDRDEIPDLTKLHFAGRLSSHTRNAEGLVAMIQRFFNFPAAIEQFVGEWLKLPGNSLCRLGVSPLTASLGINIAIGERVWQCQQKFRIVIGPLEYSDYQRMLPGRESGKRLRAMVRNYIGDSMDWDVKLVLKKEKLPPMRLGMDDLLGWNTWLGKPPGIDNVDDLILEPMRVDM